LLILGLGVCVSPLRSSPLPPTTERLGLGVTLGEPTGLSGKYWFTERFGIDSGLSYSFDDYFILWGGALYHFTFGIPDLEENIGGRFRPYLGAGMGFGISTDDGRDDKTLLFIRLPAGLEWLIQELPVGVFMEISVGVGLVPSTEALIYGGLGARYYF